MYYAYGSTLIYGLELVFLFLILMTKNTNIIFLIDWLYKGKIELVCSVMDIMLKMYIRKWEETDSLMAVAVYLMNFMQSALHFGLF